MTNRLQLLTANDGRLIGAKAQRRTFKMVEEIIHQGSPGDKIVIVRAGEVSVELSGAISRSVLATLGPDDICGDMAFLEKGKATAAVIARSVEVAVDEVKADDLREIFEAFPRLASRFYQSLAMVLARRLRDTSRELAREMAASNRRK